MAKRTAVMFTGEHQRYGGCFVIRFDAEGMFFLNSGWGVVLLQWELFLKGKSVVYQVHCFVKTK